MERGSLTAVRAAVSNLPGPPPLEDALVICLLLRDQEPDRYERAALKWLGRLLLEPRGVSLRHAELAAVYLAAWADPARRDAATEALGELGRTVGLRQLGDRIAPRRPRLTVLIVGGGHLGAASEPWSRAAARALVWWG